MNGERPAGVAKRQSLGTGVVALALLCGGAAVAVWLARRYHEPVVGGLISALFGLPSLYLAYAAFRENRIQVARAEAAEMSLEQVANEIAAAVRIQWQAEAQARRLNDPYPLPVKWVPADASLVDSWDGLRTLAESGAGWRQRSGPWAAGPISLSGEGNQLADTLAGIPTGRLIVLGEPGAGKTMLMVRLILDLFEQRGSGAPVPMLMAAASWDPMAEDLREWLELRLAIDHPGLGGPAPRGSRAVTRAGALLDAGLITLILDGLDEIPDALRGPAITRINDAIRPGEQIVVTCRTAAYRDAVKAGSGTRITLRGSAGIELQPLDISAITDYLSRDAGEAIGNDRWKPVFSSLGTSNPIAVVLSNPLMLSLARTIYNPRPGEHSGPLPDPAELCTLANKEDIEESLLDVFIQAAYRSRSMRRDHQSWPAKKAEGWLIFLARHLEYTIGTSDFSWWQLVRAVPGLTGGLTAGIMAAIVAGSLTWVAVGPAIGLAGGAIALIFVGLRAFEDRAPLGGFRYQFPGITKILLCIIIAAFLALVLGSAAKAASGTDASVATALSVGVVTVFLSVVVAGLKMVTFDLSVAATPHAIFARDRRTVITFAVSSGLAAATPAALLAGFLSRQVADSLIAGSCTFVVIVFAFTLSRGAWLPWVLTRTWLAVCGKLPWRLTDFLADAHKRGVLRQVGAVYQFRHAELQQRLGSRQT